MKKLLITTMAAVSVGLCAKAADDGFISGTSFDDSTLNPGDSFTFSSDYWTVTDNSEDLFKIIEVAYPDGVEKKHWDLAASGEKALSIDTANPILRNVNQQSTQDNSYPAQNVSETPVFFDSVVQFTATDVAGEPAANDKLRVWLYSSPDDVSATNPGLFKETTTKRTLVITAGVLETNNGVQSIVKKDYDTGIEIEPESWHRLTIKSFLNADKTKLMFNVWLDGAKDPITAEGVTHFLSLVTPNEDSDNYLQGVAFDGKGAVDDIVFTTTEPEFTKEPEAEKYAFTLNFSENVEIYSLEIGGEKQTSVSSGSSYDVEVGKLIYLNVLPKDGYTLTFEGGTFGSDGFGGYEYSFTPSAAGSGTITITAVSTGGGSGEESEDPAKPTIGGNAVDNAGAFIAAANSGVTIKVPTDWTLDGNTLKDAAGKEYATFADYYTATLATDGTVTLELNDNAEPTIDETVADKGDAIVVTETEVALGVTNAKAGLWYGAQAYSDAACTTKVGDVTGWEKAEGTTVTVTATKPVGDKAFFKVVVDDQDHTPPAEGQE